MKKFLKKSLIIFISLLLIISFTGCTSATKVEDKPQEQTIINTGNSEYTSSTTLPDSRTLAESTVTINNNEIRTGNELSYIEAIKKVENSSVAITVESASGMSAGSGTIINLKKDGDDDNTFYVLTCYHVIASEGAKTGVHLTDANGRNFGDSDYDTETYSLTGTIGGVDENGNVRKTDPVSLVGADKESDIALLRLYITDNTVKSNIEKANIMDASKYILCKGYEVFAIGNPTGTLQGTVSKGYISYMNRSVSIGGIGNMVLNQINLDIYHGSSGGGLYNMYGEIVGITNAGSDENSGLNYAIPLKTSDDAVEDKGLLNVAKQLLGSSTDKNYGYVSGRKLQFGFTVTSGTSNIPYISNVVSGSLAESAGLKVGDVVKAVKKNSEEKQEIANYQQFIAVLNDIKVGDTIILTVERTTVSYNFWGQPVSSKTEEKDITLTAYQFYFCNTVESLSANIIANVNSVSPFNGFVA